jgi:histidinol-phosphate aminotransferase
MKLRDEISSLAEYSLTVTPAKIKLNQNENPYDIPSAIKREILDRMADSPWSRYPPFVPDTQLRMLSAHTGWTADGILLGNGSNDLLQLLIMCTMDRGQSVVISQPTFTLYKLLSTAMGARVIDVPMSGGFQFDIPAIADAANTHNAGLIILCSPNNPTGSCLNRDDIDFMLGKTDALIAIDEAYVQFSGFTCVPALAANERLVVFQTFSKAMAAAGLRLGYLLGSPSIVSQLRKVKLPYSVNLFSLLALEVLLSHRNEMERVIQLIRAERDGLVQAMRAIEGITVYESGANFLLFECLRKSPKDVFRSLLREGILIRDVSAYPQLGRCLRVSVGTADENKAFLSSLRRSV